MAAARSTRRFALLVVLLAGAAVVWCQRRATPRVAVIEAPSWPPFQPVTTPPVADQRWVVPVDGACPEGYPIKANHHSGIFHVPGGRFYARTVAERCYASADDAVADGYRRAKA